MGASNAHPNPLFTFSQAWSPRKMKDLLKLQEWLYYNSSHIYAALSKLSDFSITDVVYNTDSLAVKDRMRSLMEGSLKVKQVLKAASRDRAIYGNSFVSLYLPFLRMLKCTTCKTQRNINKVDYKFKWKDASFRWTCGACNNICITKVDDLVDVRLPNAKKMNIIRWDPKLMDIEFNPITGESIYYYTIDKDMKTKIQAGNKHLLNTTPIGFLRAIKENKVFKFEEDQLFHMKVDAPAGVNAEWGMPSLTSTLNDFYHAAILKKANEALSLEFIVPFRVLHPAQANTNGDPTVMLNMGRWMDETRNNLRKHRRDPLHLQLSPVPLGVTQLGGDGRALMVLPEIEAAEANILASLGVPKEMLYGGMTFTGSAVSLRIMENQLLNQTRDLEDLMNWLGKKAGDYLGWPEVRMTLTPFKLIDDVQQKSVLLQLNSTGQLISNTTLANVFGYDLEKERRLRMQEQVDEARFGADLQTKIQKLQTSVAMQAQAKAQAGNTGLTYDAQAVAAAASQIVQQLMPLDPGSRKSELDSLAKNDFVMHACVIQLLEQETKQEQAAARQQMRASGVNN